MLSKDTVSAMTTLRVNVRGYKDVCTTTQKEDARSPGTSWFRRKYCEGKTMCYISPPCRLAVSKTGASERPIQRSQHLEDYEPLQRYMA